MKKKYTLLSSITTLFLFYSASVLAQQVPNPSFEDWSGEKFDGNIQPASWSVSNISQFGIYFNLANQETGHTGSYSLMVKDTEVGLMGITEISPGYFSLGKSWTYINGIDINTGTAGSSGGLDWTYRPDTVSVWIKRTGPHTDKEDFYILYYAWNGTAKAKQYKNKGGDCIAIDTIVDEESDIRQALNANECGTTQRANQIAEGMWREKNTYAEWTNIRVPIYYFNDEQPAKMNMLFSASNYPNFRESIGLYKDNALYVDDIEFIYSSKIDKLYIQGKEWKDFDPNSAEEQVYSVSEGTEMPDVYGVRGVGSITNARGHRATFSGRKLTIEEFQIVQQGTINGDPMIIQVNATDGSSTTTYKIKFVSASSTPNTITYELNGGITNDYGWMSKNDMFQACMEDAGVTTLASLDELKAAGEASLATICTPLGTSQVQAILDSERWDWLEAYIMSVQNADAAATALVEGTTSAGWRYAVAAFFLEMKRAAWPVSADFSLAGKNEAFQPAWKHGFANPTNPTGEFVLNTPYKEGYTFDGWYATPDFSGNKITTINASTSGTLYAKWREYTPTIAEVKALAEGTETLVSGVVTFISGKNVYIQDITGGILLYMANEPTFTVSQNIIVKGSTTLYGGAPEVTGCVEVYAEAGAMPTPIVFEGLGKLINDTELKYFAQLVKVPGLTIAEYDSYNNPTFYDGINFAKGYKMALDPVAYPIGSIVSLTAIAAWYNGFQFTGDVSGVVIANPAKKESYTYPSRDNKYHLENNWVISVKEDNYAENKLGSNGLSVVRGMAAKDAIMYFINRETESLVRVDGATGIMLAPLKITGDHLFQVQAEDGTYTDAVTSKFNDVKFDQAGNCLIGGVITSPQQHFMIYTVNLETGVATLLIDDCLGDNPAYAALSCRFDAFGVYGDVTKNAVVMAADPSSWNVFRWQIKNGVVGKGELISIELDPERDNYLASTATGFGTAPQIAPQDEYGSIFYVDGYNTLPMLFEEGGTLLDDFINVPTGTTVQNNEGETTTLHTRLNGLQEFQVGNEYFLVMAATMTNSNPPSAFALYKFADEARTFDGLEPLWYFPNDGLGSATNGCRTAVPSVEVNGNTATISIYAVDNGYASYTFTVDDSDAPIRTEETATACDSYTWNGKTYTQSGTYTYTTTAANGNDSIVTLHLTISPTLYTEEMISACDSYEWNGQTYTESGDYIYTTTATNGCDSIVTLHLTINQKQYAEETISACDSYEWNGQTYTESGNYTYTTTTTNGCDSIITLYLTINHTEEGTTENATICHGETYTWNGQTYSTSGEYRVTLPNVGGCDSLVTLNLTILPEVTYYTEYKTAPTNRTVTWRGKEYNETGLYYDTVHFVANTLCDSIIYILDLIVGDNIDSNKYCGENLTWYYSSGALIITGSGAMYDKPELLTYRNELWYPEHVNHIALPDGITHLGNVAFADCANLTNIAIPSSVTSIGDGVFSWTGLQSITIPANVTDLGEQIFESCSALSTLLYEGTPSSINNQTIHPFIGCVHLDTVIAPAALWHCTSPYPALEARYGVPHKACYIEVTNGELTDKAMEYIANNRGSLEVLDLTAATNTTLPLGALMNATTLSTLYLPQTIHTIPEMLAEGCHNLSEIIIPATATEIGNHAFAGCTNVWQITSEAVLPPTIYPETFKDIDRSISVIVPAGSEDAYRQAPYWQEFFIEQTTDNAPALVNKVLRNDRIYILRNGKIYSIMGQQVQTTYIE